MTTITLAHSPDADDLVMWWPLTGLMHPDGSAVSGTDGLPALDTRGFAFQTLAADIHTLNQRAAGEGDLDITAISAYTYPFVKDRYRITSCGGSFGDGYGPKVVVGKDSSIMCDGCLRGQRPRFAVPGDRTTAFLALSVLLGQPFDYEVVPFQDVAGAVADGTAQAGLLIHEAQLTYESMGLKEVVDLGAWWKKTTDLPLPLGLNVIRRDLDTRFGQGSGETIAELLSESLTHARAHPETCRRMLLDRVGERPEWADDALVERYLGMYVNDLTADMGDIGRGSLDRLYAEAAKSGLCPDPGTLDVI
jgi:1,4-dihydroxy-6-naphthoate synthase